jgi:acetolactate synthase-1/2/3 large subunit
MGSGIGSSVGLALGDPTRPVVCVCGDGGMQMAGMEALVALKERLRVVFAVFNDGRYNMVYHGYRQVYGREAPWSMPQVDFRGWASALGLPSARIDRPGELTRELFEDLTREGPALLDLRIDSRIPFGGGGRNEALLRMSMLARSHEEAPGGQR